MRNFTKCHYLVGVNSVLQGDSILLQDHVTFVVRLPSKSDVALILGWLKDKFKVFEVAFIDTDSKLINMKQIIQCPYCSGNANLHKEAKELNYRKEKVKIVAHFYKCEKCNEEFTTTEADTFSLTQADNQYRKKIIFNFRRLAAPL